MKMREIRVLGADYMPRIREAADGGASRIIEGYSVVFGRESVLLCDYWEEYREIIEPGAIDQALLDSSDIKMTLWHNRERLLARRNYGAGTLDSGIDSTGVWYRFVAPATPDGDTALELVRRGDLGGSSFMYTTDEVNNVRYEKLEDGTVVRHVMKISRIYDMTIASDPAYTDTTVNAREVERRFAGRESDAEVAACVRRLREDANSVFRKI